MRLNEDHTMFIVNDDHRYPVLFAVSEDTDNEFVTIFTRRARIGFESGSWLSVIWGSFTYSDNYDHAYTSRSFKHDPGTVEVLASWMEEPEGYVGEARLLELIAEGSNRPAPMGEVFSEALHDEEVL